MSLESILLVVAPICLFTVGVIVLPILVKPIQLTKKEISKTFLKKGGSSKN